MLLPERQCHACDAPKKKRWGCEEDLPQGLGVVIDGEETRRCPMRPFLLNPTWYNEILQVREWWHKGWLPDPGTYRDQPVRLLHLIEILDGAFAAAQGEKKRRSEAETKKAGQSPAIRAGKGRPQARAGAGRRR